MEIKGKIHLLFEQSGTFKNEFKKLGYDALDYDIQNNFNETNHVIDLFNEIEQAYENKSSIFDNMSMDDLIIAFFPCVYFTGSSNPLEFSLCTHTNLSIPERISKIIKRSQDREKFYELLLKLFSVTYSKNLRLVFENPYSSLHFLDNNFLKQPDVIDKNRMLRGDYFQKPTAYWFFNCEPTYGESYQNDKKQKKLEVYPEGKAMVYVQKNAQ